MRIFRLISIGAFIDKSAPVSIENRIFALKSLQFMNKRSNDDIRLINMNAWLFVEVIKIIVNKSTMGWASWICRVIIYVLIESGFSLSHRILCFNFKNTATVLWFRPKAICQRNIFFSKTQAKNVSYHIVSNNACFIDHHLCVLDFMQYAHPIQLVFDSDVRWSKNAELSCISQVITNHKNKIIIYFFTF